MLLDFLQNVITRPWVLALGYNIIYIALGRDVSCTYHNITVPHTEDAYSLGVFGVMLYLLSVVLLAMDHCIYPW